MSQLIVIAVSHYLVVQFVARGQKEAKLATLRH